MKLIPLTQGKFAMVDDEDFGWLSQYKWFYNCGYAVRKSRRPDGTRCSIKMHREILNTPQGLCTDHIDFNGVNNQKQNLRICTWSENLSNKPKGSANQSGFKGVSWHGQHKKFQVRIMKHGKEIHLGYYKTAEEASLVYQAAAKIHHGEFARW